MYCKLPCKNFKTNRLYIRFVEEKDYKAFFDFTGDDEVTYYLPMKSTKTLKENKEALNNMYRAYLQGSDINYSIVLNSFVIGSISINFDKDINQVEIGYLFNRKYWNNGYAYEALSNLLIVLKEYYKVDKVIAKCVAENNRSSKLLYKLDFELESINKNQSFKNKVNYDILNFSKTL